MKPLEAIRIAFEKYTPMEQKRIMLAREAAAEGMVLLENRHSALPLCEGERTAILGVGQINFLTGGSGSGAMNCNYTARFSDAMLESGVCVDRRLIGRYQSYCEDFNAREVERQRLDSFSLKRTVEELELEKNEMDMLAENNDTALVVISRMAGEGTDRGAVPGDFYLTDVEMKMLMTARSKFEKLVVVLNTASIMDMEWIDEVSPDAVLMTWLAGMEGASAAADILTGKICPSGRLTDTIAHSLEDHPSTVNFGAFIDGYEEYIGEEGQVPYWGIQANHAPVPVGTTVRRPINNYYYTRYAEGLYVGYRYFSTFGKDVRYPFGYGLSYTSFSLTADEPCESQGGINISTTVVNTGKVAGKAVIQAYVCKPSGGLENPKRELVSFEKTPLLAPGESISIVLNVRNRELSNYDEESASYVLQQGKYCLYVGENVSDASLCGTLELNERVVLSKLSNLGSMPESRKMRMLSRYDPEVTWPKAPEIKRNMPMEIKAPVASEALKRPDLPEAKWKLADVVEGNVGMEEFVSQMHEIEMICLVTGIGMGPGGRLMPPVLDAPTCTLKGATGVTATILRLGIPSIVMSDGPAGVKAPGKPNQIAFPTAQSIACTWNQQLSEKIGDCVGGEAEDSDVDIWLAPAMNLHRNPLCGRNYEYFSEDPFLSGKMAAAITRGVASHNVSGCLKHFAANNQETNRFYGVDSLIPERVLRELYLRGFEIAVTEGKVMALMTGYNGINGGYCSTKRDILEGIVRGEWKFDGVIMTDWEGGGIYAPESLAAGNDLLMPGATGQRAYLMECYKNGKLTRKTLEACCINILNMIIRTTSYSRFNVDRA